MSAHNSESKVDICLKNNLCYFLIRNDAGDTPFAVACRHGHLNIVKMYMHCHDHIGEVFHVPANIPYLEEISSQCGQFEIAYYLQSNYGHVNTTLSESEFDMYYEELDGNYCRYCFSSCSPLQRTFDHSITITVERSKYWNIYNFSSALRSFCMATLHGNEKYVSKFLTLQEGRFYGSVDKNSIVEACIAATIADNVDILNHYFCSEVVLEDDNTLLHIACEWGSKAVAEHLITTRKYEINVTNGFGETPLHVACRHDEIEIVQLFLQTSQHDVFNKLNLSSETPLHVACLHSDSAVAHLFLDVDHLCIDMPDQYGDTPLMNACRSGNLHLVKCLAERGCNPLHINSVSKEMTVHVACRMQRLDILKVLLTNFEGKVDHRNNFGETPLCIALNTFCVDIVKFFVHGGLCDVSLSLSSQDLKLKSKYLNNPIPQSILLHETSQTTSLGREVKQDKSSHKPSGDNALHFACRRNDFDLLKLLLNHCPANLTAVNNFGHTPLHIAAKNGSVSMMECLIASCKVPLDSLINNDGNSVLHLACERGSLNVAQLLLRSCSLTLKNNDGNTPIHLACYNKSAELVGCLLNKCSGNLDNHKNKNNDTFLHIAAEFGDLDTIKLLLNHCSTTCQNMNDDTPIHIACRANNQSVVECLLKYNTSSYPFANKDGQTYLHAACNENANLSIVKAIFENGYENLGNWPDKDGDIPLHYACRFYQIDIVEYLMTINNCDPYRFNKKGLSPLYFAVENENTSLILYVINKRLCDINQPVKEGSPFLHCVIQLASSQSPAQLFMQDEFDQIHTLTDGVECFPKMSPDYVLAILHILAKESNKGIIDINATDGDGNTALHLACKSEQYQVVRELLSSDAVGQSLSHSNHNGKRPIQLTNNYSIIRLLISYGATPEDVYERFALILEKSKEEHPLEPAVKIFVLGNATAGKTTLVQVLKSDKKDVMQVKGSTAGIETSKHNSKDYGQVTFHDFAGQPEYESSHSAFLEQCSSSMQPPLFLLVVDASEYQYIEKKIHYWLSFIQNHCTCSSNTPPHVIVLGSHIDKVEDIQLSYIYDTFVKAIENFKSRDFECFEPVFLDCRKVDTEGMKTLLSRLNTSCLSLKRFVELDCRCHILFASLLKWFPIESVVKVNDLLRRIRQRKRMDSGSDDSPTSESLRPWNFGTFHFNPAEDSSDSEFLLPISTDPLINLLKSLQTGGHILLLEGETLEDSWIVMDQDALFKTVNGILFAPKDFRNHLELDNNTGVVPLAKLQKLFPDLDFGMIKQFLILCEFCQKIEDHETLKLIHGSNELIKEVRSLSHTYYFFPGLVQSEKPTKVWDTPKESPYSFSCGWMLQCQSRQFFETRFLHVLLLRLTFTFVACTSEASMFKRKCNIWKNGIHWGTTDGVEVFVELLEEKTLILVLVRCYKGQELEAVKLRTAVLKNIWEVKNTFSPKVNADEYLIHPSCLNNYTSLQNITKCQIGIKEISQTVLKGSLFVVCPPNNKPLPLDALLYYEPYSRMDEEHLKLMFSQENANNTISPEILLKLSTFLHPVYQHLIKVLKIPETELGFHRDKWREHPVQLLHHLFESWTSRREKPTFQTLRSEFDEYSIFFGRDPQV